MNMETSGMKKPGFGFKIKEFFRKKLVTLKRNPQMIPLIMLLVAFLVYSLSLTNMSNTTAKINRTGMGLCQFGIMLMSMLSMVCMLNAFPKRKKANIPMIVLMMGMFTLMILCAILYRGHIVAAVFPPDGMNAIVIDVNTLYIKKAYDMLMTFMILIGVTAALVVLLPVYSRLLKKINTNIDVEDNGDMAKIELTD